MAVATLHGGSTGSDRAAVDRRALALWPGLSRQALTRCGHDPRRIAALVSRRTSLSPESIYLLLTMPDVAESETIIWFG